MKALKHYFPSVLFVGLLLALGFWILWTSLDFQECIKAYGTSDPSDQHLNKSISRIVSSVLTWRHCAGAYVLDKNAVINAISTVFIAIFTTILAVFTVRLAGSTRIAADAANLNALAVINAERAHLYVIVTQHNVSDLISAVAGFKYTEDAAASKMEPPTLAYVFRNYGKTPATIEMPMHCLTIRGSEKGGRTYKTFDRAIEIINAGDDTEPIADEFSERAFFGRDAKALGDDDISLYFFSEATFMDTFGRRYTIAHDFLYSAGRFHLIGRTEATHET